MIYQMSVNVSCPYHLQTIPIYLIMGLIYCKLFQLRTCWYLQVVKSEQIIIEYKKDSLYDIFPEEIRPSSGFTNK